MALRHHRNPVKRINRMLAPMKMAIAATVLTLAACTNMDGTPSRPATGVVIGGLTGAALGNAVGHSRDATLIGAAAGAVIGGTIGTQLEMQHAELSRDLAGSGAQVINTGSAIELILPENVTFAFGSFVVNTSFYDPLAAVVRNLNRHPRSTVRVVGHTDNVGSAAYNDNLSVQRALAVSRILLGNGLSSARLTYAGNGFRQPIASNATSEGRAMNRRVEIFITPN
jgi:outer membrane protein OmpA-like peptidoglycan-associated protein